MDTFPKLVAVMVDKLAGKDYKARELIFKSLKEKSRELSGKA